MSSNIKIIQISDLHCKNVTENDDVDDKENILLEKDYERYDDFKIFQSYLTQIVNDGFYKCILVNGDLSDKCNEVGLKKIEVFLKECADILSIPYKNIIITPGNHDIYQEDNTKEWDVFRQYTKEFCTPFNEETLFFEFEKKVLIYPLNSTRIDRQDIKFSCKKGRIRKFICRESPIKKSLKEIPIVDMTKLVKYMKQDYRNIPVVRILALHHHVVPVWGIESKHFDIVLNAGDILQFAQENSVSLILHGHKHKPGVKFIQDISIKQSPVGIYIVSARAFKEHGNFNEIEISFESVKLPKITYNSKCIENGHVKDQDSSLDFSQGQHAYVNKMEEITVREDF